VGGGGWRKGALLLARRRKELIFGAAGVGGGGSQLRVIKGRLGSSKEGLNRAPRKSVRGLDVSELLVSVSQGQRGLARIRTFLAHLGFIGKALTGLVRPE